MTVTLQTERLILRNFTPADTEPLHRTILQYQATPYAAFDHPWPTDEAGIAGAVAWFASGDDYLAVCLKDTGEYLGFVCLNPGENHTFNLGYIFGADYHGQGYAGEACRAMLGRTFDDLAAELVVSGTPLIHDASIRLLKRLGFVQPDENEGFFRLTREAWEKKTKSSPPTPSPERLPMRSGEGE
jgi:[ribosomal protein S5]-alanine N-acetyltransferase